MLNLLQLPNRSERERPRGQVMVILALAFIGLASFIGLTVDAGILFVQIGHLRRAVDSASLAAAAQFREGRSLAEMEAAAEEFINLNSLSPGFAEVFVCDISDPTVGNTNPYHDITLCPPDDNSDGVFDDSPFRKFVRVNGEVLVEFSFLPIIGFGSVPIRASAVSETASVDIILAIDTSPSIAPRIRSVRTVFRMISTGTRSTATTSTLPPGYKAHAILLRKCVQRLWRSLTGCISLTTGCPL
jgi:hypothetical protein